MTIIIQGIVFVDVSESFAERVILGMQKSGRPSINKAEAMTEDLSADELKVLDILSERINTDTLKTNKPMSFSAIVRETITRMVRKGVNTISTKELIDTVLPLSEKKRTRFQISSMCGNILKRMGGKSLEYGIWQLPSINDLSED